MENEISTKPQAILDNWKVVTLDNPYLPPEAKDIHIEGNVYNHPRHHDGKSVTTTRVLKVEGRTIETNNSVYILKEPDPDYVQWCKDKGVHVPDGDSPIKVKNNE